MRIQNKLKLKTKRAASLFMAATLVFSNAAFSNNMLTVQAEETLKAFPGVRTESDSDGNVFLGGNYIEIGISKHGSFGTSLHPTDSITGSSYTSKAFHDSTQYSGLGLQSDGDGWNSGNDPVTGDFFLPGTPEERWMLSYKKNGSVYQYYVADRSYYGSLMQSWITEPSVVDTTVGDTLSARVYGKTAEGVEITMDYSFGVDDLEYLTHVTVNNTGDTDISDVVFVRSFDPDQDQQYNGEFETYNKVICNPDKTKKAGADNYAMVVARGPVTLGGFFFLAIDNRARVSCNYSFGITDAYDSKLWTNETYSPTTSKTYADTEDVEMTKSNTNGYELCDQAISIAFNVGTITSGNSDSLEFYSSLDPNVTESLDKLKKALGLTLDYGAESIKGLDGEGIYHITRESDNKTWKLVVDADKNYSLYDEEGTVIDTGVYDEDQEMGIKLIDEWYDCTLTIQKEAVGDTTYEPAQITIPARPQAPDDPSAPNLDNSAPSEIKASDVITTTDSIIVKAVEGQEYTLDGGKTWKKPDSNGQVEFTDLEDGREYTIQTRIAATKDSLCSYTSKGLTVKTRKMFDDLVETEYTGEYDAKSHIVKVSTDVEDAKITYSLSLDTLETEGVEEPFAFTDAGTFTVYYKVEKDGYYTSYGDLQAVIKGRNVQVHINDNHKTYGDTEPELTYTVSGLLDGYELNGITLSRTEGEDAGEYTITGTHTSMPGNIYDVTFTNEGSFYITKRTMNITWKDMEFTYDGEEHIPAAEITNLVNGDDCELIVTGGQTDAGTYEAQIIGVTGDKSSNYEFPDNVDAVSYEIKKAAQTAPVVHAVAETIDGRADGKILDVTDHMEYRMKGESEYTDIDDTQLVDLTAGTYDVRMKADNNHFASEDTAVVVEAGRKLLVTLPETQTGYTLKADKNNLSWKETSVLTFNLADGYSKTSDFAVKVNGVAIEADTEEGNVYTLSDVTQDQDVTVEGIADITNPTGEIVVSTNRWAKLLNAITFGTFFKDTQDVNITAEDKGSGVKSVEYYVSDKALTEEEIKTVVWTGFDGRFSINPNGNYVVYAKITDHAGNVTYLSTDGLVLDNAAPVITGIENGAVYCTPKTIKITDEHLDKITVNVGGEEKEIEADEFTLTPDTLGTQIITAADKAGNTTVYKVTFVEHDYSDVKVVEPTTLDKGYTIYTCVRCGESYRDNYTEPLGSSNLKPFDKKQLEEAMNEAKNRLEDTTKPLTEEEKKLYEDVYKQAESLLNNIEKAEDNISDIDKIDTELPESDSITSNDKDKLEDALKKIDELLDENNPSTPTESLTEEQKQKLQQLKEEILKKKELIEKVESEKNTLEKEVAEIPSKDDVTPENKEAIEKLMDKIDAFVNENGTHFTEEETKQLVSAKEELLGKLKEIAKNEIDAAAAEAKAAIEKLSDLTEAEKEEALKAVDKAAEEAKKNIEEAKVKEEISTKLEIVTKDIENVKEESKQTDLANVKQKTAAAIDAAAEEAKAAIDKLTHLSEEQKNELKEQVDANAEKAKKELEEITNPEDKAKLADIKADAVNAVEKKTEEAKDQDYVEANYVPTVKIDNVDFTENVSSVTIRTTVVQGSHEVTAKTIRYREVGSDEYVTVEVTGEETEITGLNPGTEYEIIIVAEDANGNEVTDSMMFRTKTDSVQGQGSVSGSIQSESAGAGTFTASLQLGNTVIESKANIADGEAFTFDGLADGEYNLVVSDGTHKVTKRVSVKDGTVENIGKIVVSSLQTTVKVEGNAPKLAIDGLDKLYNTSIFKENETAKDSYENGGTVEVRLTADDEKDETVKTLIQNKVQSLVTKTETTTTKWNIGFTTDLKLDMIMTSANAEETIQNIRDAKSPIMAAIPLNQELQGKDGYRMFRVHNYGNGDVIEELNYLTEADRADFAKEGFWVDGGYVYVVTQYFSNYTLTYMQTETIKEDKTETPADAESTPEVPEDTSETAEEDSVKTGDNSIPVVWLFALVAAGAGIALSGKKSRKRTTDK